MAVHIIALGVIVSEELMSLITLAQAGDEGAFADLTVQYKPLLESSVKSYSKKYAGELYTEEDFFQEASPTLDLRPAERRRSPI